MSENQHEINFYQAVGFWARCYGWHCFTHRHQLLFFPHCYAVHALGLKTYLWVLFVNKQGEPLSNWRCLRPNHLLWHRGAYGVLERAHMSIEKCRLIDARLQRKPSWLNETICWEVDYWGRKYYEK